MKRCLVAAVMVCWSMTAFAGKGERELVKKELEPKVKEAETNFKSSCGCALAITIDPVTLDKKDDIRNARNIARSVAENAPKYCTDEASKKAVCQMSTLLITKSKPAQFTFNAGKGQISHDGSGYATWDMMMRVLDK